MNFALNFLFLVVIVVVCIENSESLSSINCPTASRVDSCNPKCKDNTCPGSQMCCSNICGTKSCTDINQYLDKNKGSSNSKYGTNSNSKYGSTGGYCGNNKCNANEKCERQKCVRV